MSASWFFPVSNFVQATPASNFKIPRLNKNIKSKRPLVKKPRAAMRRLALCDKCSYGEEERTALPPAGDERTTCPDSGIGIPWLFKPPATLFLWAVLRYSTTESRFTNHRFPTQVASIFFCLARRET